VPLCTLHMQLKPPIVVGTACAGRRVIVEVASVEVKGDRLRGEMMGAAAADWLLIGPEGTVRPTSGRHFAPMTARSSSCSTPAE